MALTDNLVSYWKFDEASGNASDSTASINTLTNNGTVTYAASKINNGADFGNANTSKCLNRTGYVVSDGAQSFSFWVKQQTEIASGTQTYVFSGSQSTAMYVNYEYNAGTRRLVFSRIHNNVASASIAYIITLGIASFYHVVATYNLSTLSLYVNGALIASTADSGNGTTNWSPGGGYFTVGAQQDANGGAILQYSSAFIDELGVWSRVLSQAEVTTLYSSGVGIQYPFPNSLTMTAATGTFGLAGLSSRFWRANLMNVAKPVTTFTNITKP